MARRKLVPNNLTQEERNKLVEDNLGIAYELAKKLCPDPDMYEDCVSEAVLEMVTKVVYWDPNNAKGTKWSTWAYREVKDALMNFLYNNRLIKISSSDNSIVYAYHRERRNLEAALNRELTSSELFEISKRVGMREEMFQAIHNKMSSMDEPVGKDYAETLKDHIPDRQTTEDFVMETESVNNMLSEIFDFINTTSYNDPKYKDICKQYIMDLVKDEFSGPKDEKEAETMRAKKANFQSAVLKVCKDLEVKETDTEEEVARKTKELDRIYTRLSGVWGKDKKALRNHLAVALN